MRDVMFEGYQSMIDDHLIRHRSILDIITKFQDTASRVNRAVIKAVTSCGCIEIHADRQELPDEDISFESLKNYMDSHITGSLCSHCRSVIEDELGNHLFFMASLANTLGISLYDIILNEEKKMSTLGKYNLR